MLCRWFAACTREAELLVPHPAFEKGVPTCAVCASRFGLEGTPMPFWEVWFKDLWNAAVDLLAAVPADATGPEHPWHGVMETMHGIAEGHPEMRNAKGLLDKLA